MGILTVDKLPRAQAGWIVLETYNLSYDLFLKLLKILGKSNVEWLGILKTPGSIDVLIADHLFTIALSPFDLIIKDHDILKEIDEWTWMNKYVIARDTWLDYIMLDISFLNEIFDNIERQGYYSGERFEIIMKEAISCNDVLVVNHSTIMPPGIFGSTALRIPYDVIDESWKKGIRVIAICIYEDRAIPVVYVVNDKKPILFVNRISSFRIGNPIHFFIIDFVSMFETRREIN